MKKHTRTPDPAMVSAGENSSGPSGRASSNALWHAAELFACLLTALMPVKFASFVSAPEGGALYWGDPLSLLVIAWPLPVFMMAASLLLVLTVAAALCRKDMTFRPLPLKYGALWGILGCVSLLGLANASCMGYPPQMIAHTLSMAAYALSLSILLGGRDGFARMLTGALILGGILSLYSGMDQYLRGFDALREHIRKQSEAVGHDIAGEGMAVRIREGRVQADFNSCNVYGAYLAALLPFLTALFWRFGNERVTPPKLSRCLFGGLVFAVTFFLLVKTDSRGAVFSLLAAGAAVFFFSRLPRKWKLAGAGLLLLGAAGLVCMVRFGRGALSMYVRFDYVQSAARMMLGHPLTGTGWGDFLHDHMIFRLWRDKEAAHSPHNMVMTFGSQCGIAGFAAALAVLAYPVASVCRQVRRTDWRNPSDFFALVPGISCLILSAGALLDIGFETTAYCGALVAFSLLVLKQDAPADAEPLGNCCRPPVCRGIALLLAVFAGISFVLSMSVFHAEKTYSKLVAELKPEYSFEHQNDPGYAPSHDRVKSLLQEADSAAPRSPFPSNAAADHMFMTGHIDDALLYLDRAIRYDPLQSSNYVKRACMLYWQAGMNVTDAVRRDLKTARSLAPKNPELDRPDADICRAAFTPKEP
jgi:hypothetical protein